MLLAEQAISDLQQVLKFATGAQREVIQRIINRLEAVAEEPEAPDLRVALVPQP